MKIDVKSLLEKDESSESYRMDYYDSLKGLVGVAYDMLADHPFDVYPKQFYFTAKKNAKSIQDISGRFLRTGRSLDQIPKRVSDPIVAMGYVTPLVDKIKTGPDESSLNGLLEARQRNEKNGYDVRPLFIALGKGRESRRLSDAKATLLNILNLPRLNESEGFLAQHKPETRIIKESQTDILNSVLKKYIENNGTDFPLYKTKGYGRPIEDILSIVDKADELGGDGRLFISESAIIALPSDLRSQLDIEGFITELEDYKRQWISVNCVGLKFYRGGFSEGKFLADGPLEQFDLTIKKLK